MNVLIECKIGPSSFLFGGNGVPWVTLQKAQFRVHVMPNIIKVSTPFLKHSNLLGQRASWQILFGTSVSSTFDKDFVAANLPLDFFNHFGKRCFVAIFNLFYSRKQSSLKRVKVQFLYSKTEVEC